ncbi:hypothetical protein CALVIDRAFT_477266, partial [Calocera viscosa TUFC12733]
VHLLRRGILACTPERPEAGFRVEVLELLHAARLRAYVSHEAFARILCDLHGIPYRKTLRQQLSNAYDAYILIILEHRRILRQAFGQNTPHWRLLNACSACDYRLKDEPTLPHSKLLAADGNNSSKRFAKAGNQDQRLYESDYIIPPEEVDQFENEVHGHRRRTKPQAEADVMPSAEGAEPSSLACTQKWKTFQAKDHASHWMDGLHETGNFLCVCRHGLVHYSVDMVKSGELAKYPIACLHKLLHVYGPDLALGYDIGCEHSTTVARSSIGDLAKTQNLRFYVGAFHGYAHNRKCQLAFHPRFLTTTGLEDFETNERLFSKQNLTAHLFRHASQYHRQMTLDFFWTRWDEDRRAGLADWLYDKYRQALDIVRTTAPEVERIQSDHAISDEDFLQFLDEEQKYLHRLQHEPEAEVLAYKYLETLKSLHAEEAAQRDYLTIVHAIHRYEQLAVHYENQLQTERWAPESDEWRNTEDELRRRTYNQALDHLEALVVQRLFEMEKLSLRGTGYALRTHLAKALRERSEAIRTALQRYNNLARQVKPPRPTLSFQEVVDYSFLSEFTLLRNSREDIRAKRWSDPFVRETTVKWLLVRCARVELKCLNVEVCRLWTALHDEPQSMMRRIRRAEAQGDFLVAAEMSSVLVRRLRVDELLKRRLEQVFSLPGFSGLRTRGVRVEQTTEHTASVDAGLDLDRDLDLDSGAQAELSDDGDGWPESHGWDEPDEFEQDAREEFDRLALVLDNMSIDQGFPGVVSAA